MDGESGPLKMWQIWALYDIAADFYADPENQAAAGISESGAVCCADGCEPENRTENVPHRAAACRKGGAAAVAH
mgnify:CR=1 FL=1